MNPHCNYDDPVVVQDPSYAIGNFINCTPAIKAISECIDKRVRVWFATPHVRDMFLRCPFIKIMEDKPINYWSRGAPGPEVLFQSCDINQSIPDYMYHYLRLAKGVYGHKGPVPHTYVDSPKKVFAIAGHDNHTDIGIVRGAVSEQWHNKKDPGNRVYHAIMDIINAKLTNYRFVFIGGNKDKEWWFDEMQQWYPHCTQNYANDDIRWALTILNSCKYIIANDSGLYHAAVALRKPVFVMWKHTNPVKNRAPGKYATHSIGKDNWIKDFIEWFEKIQEI